MIGILDSGIGGVTVFLEVLKLIPKGHFIYYSDSINNPYGDKNSDVVYDIVKNIVDYLLKRGCRAILIACNTASNLCVEKLRDEYQDVLFIAIEPAYKMVHDFNKNGKTLVMATKRTIESEKFLNLYHRYDNHNTILLACPGLADLIENSDDDLVDDYLSNNLSSFSSISNVVLGCTHYPLIKKKIEKVLGPVLFFDGSIGTAKQLKAKLDQEDIKYQFKELEIEFIDSSNSLVKEKRFWTYLSDKVI